MRAVLLVLVFWVVGCGGGNLAKDEQCAVYEDSDEDGFGNPDVKAYDCAGSSGWPSNGDDCNDDNASVYPGAPELCDPPGIDEDCDGLLDAADPDAGAGGVTAWPDSDGDGFGDAANGPVMLCALQAGYVQEGTDCNDASDMTYPGAAELDGTDCMEDADDDGYGSDTPTGGGVAGTDCDDNDPTVFPGAAFNESLTECFTDGDGDGYGPESEGGGDCDDADPDTYVGAPEILVDGIDQDCDGFDSYGWFDDFEGGPPLGANGVWSAIQGDALIDNAYAANGVSSLTMSGASGVARTNALDTSVCPIIAWWYEGKRGPESPDAGDTLNLEWSIGGVGWSPVDSWAGDGGTDADFSFRTGEIYDVGAYAADFQFRLVSTGTANSDDFHIDDFFIGCPGADLDGDGFYEMNDCDDNDAAHWSDCGACVDADGDDYGFGCDLGDDCDDGNAAVNPGVTEIPDDGLDQNCDGIDSILMFDDFELGIPDPIVWASVSGDAQMDAIYVDSGVWSLVLGGGGGDVISNTLDTTACTDVMWSFRGKRGPEQPDVGDWLRVEYDAGAGWVESFTWAGGATDPAFSDQFAIIPDPLAKWSGFRVRLISSGSGINTDEFYVDDFAFGCAEDNDADGYLAGQDCDDNDANHWSDCGACVDADGDDYGAGCDLGPDCDDADPAVNPGAVEVDGDGVDSDCNGLEGDGLVDDFELGAPDPGVWASITGDYFYETTYVNAGVHSLNLGGGIGVATSVVYDTTSCNSVSWFYMGKRGPQAPTTNEFLTLEYDNGVGWVPADAWEGNAANDASFVLRQGVIANVGALWSGFRVRFTTNGTGIGFDDFFIDDLAVGCADDNDGDGILASQDCDDNDPAHYFDCGLCVDVDGDDYGTFCDLGSDCDDTDPAIYPGAAEIDGDGIDSDCNGIDGAGIVDDFELGAADPAVWSAITGDFGYDVTYVNAGTYSLNMGGGIATATSVVFDSTSCTSVSWAYMGKRGPEAPDTNEFLTLEYDDGVGWVLVDDWEGATVIDGVFALRQGVIADVGALWSGFRVRFTTNGSGAGTDDFFIDDLVVGCADDQDGDGVLSSQDCDDNDPAHWFDCGFCVDVDGDDFGALCDLGGDCDDGDPNIYPGAPEVDGDGIDSDCNGVDGSGIIDDFETGAADPLVWTSVTGDFSYSTLYVNAGTYSLNLGGGIGTAHSIVVDASTCSSIVWSYQGKRGPETPDANEFLSLAYDDGFNWIPVDDWEGGATDASFSLRQGTIVDPAAMWSGFRIQFTTNGSGTGTDDFFIDDLVVACGQPDADGDGVSDALDCAVNDPDHWADCGLCVDADGDGYGSQCDLGADCNDINPAIYPGAPEINGDGIDSDCDGLDSGGLFDDFEFGFADPAVWASITGDYDFNTTYVYAGTYSLRLGGGIATATSVVYNSSGCNSIDWEYQGKRGPETPDAGDWMRLEYWDGLAWVLADEWAGTGVTDASFSYRSGNIVDPFALSPTFQVRFSSDGTGVGFDDYFIDDFALGCGP